METIRAARVGDAVGIARVQVDSWRTTYAGLMPDHVIASRSYEEREQMWTQILQERETQGFTFVAENEAGQLVGFIDGGRERESDPRYTGEVYALYLLAEYQGHGLGRQLMRAAVEKLLATGSTTMLIWVLATNPARHFYEALGGQFIKTKQDRRDGYALDEVAYGWPDIRVII